MKRLNIYKAVTVLVLVLVALCTAILIDREDAQAYNSEEHRLLVDEAMAFVEIDSSIIFPTGTSFDYFNGHVKQIREAKQFAVGYQTNDVTDYDDKEKGVQDNSYWTGYKQREGNFKIWIPENFDWVAYNQDSPYKTLFVDTKIGNYPSSFTLGQLVAFYGDYRRTVYCDAGGGDCWITNNPVETMYFSHGTECFGLFNCDYQPAPMRSWQYLSYIMSGLWPPFARSTALQPTEENQEAFWEAAWWGDEMMRIANVNDWHFSNGAVAWYVGMHRLALAKLGRAIAENNSRMWNAALHYEANALHGLTDLFALGHVVTNRSRTAHGIMKNNDLLNDTEYKWMENVIKMGGGYRDTDGKTLFNTEQVKGRISEVEHWRHDFMPSYAGNWASYALSENYYHEHFNETGATVRNLQGDTFYIYGDYKYRNTAKDSRNIIMNAVIKSVQSLFDAYVKLKEGVDIEEIGSKGSSYFEALKYIPVFIEKTPENYFWGEYTSYAEAVDRITGTDILEINYVIEYLDGEYNKDSYTIYPGPEDLRFPMKKVEALDTFPDVTVDVEEQPSSLPVTMSLSQNYPNPFNPGSTIEFSLTMSSEVTITIYNTLGQTVRQLADETYPAGTHSVQWNGRDHAGKSVPAGVYIYNLEAGEFSASKQMTLLK